MAKAIHRGETKLIRLRFPNENLSITELQDVIVTIEQGTDETKLHLSDFIYVADPEMYQYRISQEMSLSWKETSKCDKHLHIGVIWYLRNGTRKESRDKVFEILPTKHNEVMT